MLIGNFNKSGDNYTGVIATLTINLEAVFEPIEKRGEKGPDFRVTSGETDIGAAWKRTSEETGSEYLSVSLDCPALASPIACRLVKTGAEHAHALFWERQRPKKDSGK